MTRRNVHDGGLGAPEVEYAGSNTSNRYWNFTVGGISRWVIFDKM